MQLDTTSPSWPWRMIARHSLGMLGGTCNRSMINTHSPLVKPFALFLYYAPPYCDPGMDCGGAKSLTHISSWHKTMRLELNSPCFPLYLMDLGSSVWTDPLTSSSLMLGVDTSVQTFARLFDGFMVMGPFALLLGLLHQILAYLLWWCKDESFSGLKKSSTLCHRGV